MEKTLAFGFVCYTEETPQGDITEPVNVELFGEKVKEVEAKALEFSGRPNARLKTIAEVLEPSPTRPDYMCTVQCYETIVGGQLVGMVQMELFANSPKEAIERAKALVTKKFYRLRQIVEKTKTEK